MPQIAEPSSSKDSMTYRARADTPSDWSYAHNEADDQVDRTNTLTKHGQKGRHPARSDRKGKGKAKADESFTLDESETSMYLSDSQIFHVRPPPLDVQVSRKALTEKYRLPGMGFLWKSKNQNRPLKFMLPELSLNPDMPRLPGEPGLLLSCREEMLEDGPWTLFIKVNFQKKVRLNYAGEYTCTKVGTLTKYEFTAQDKAVSTLAIESLHGLSCFR